ncbi:Phosphotyrosyl phosphatase activator [Irpex rosettiformis]|uniref:Phosphotyrosyl phosphatase activator n=1 Tax=Irpex rosettiformis TaxID=378272 RepID=A0ACB8U1G1_9APHY|nr:Phosphotyrosyl phosphatase activator [Irpex rosettiformis]
MTTRKFIQPYKAILTPEQLAYFQKESKTHKDIVAFVERLNDSVTGVKLTAECTESEGVSAILHVLDQVEAIAKDTPPVDNKASRFGNPAFRTFYDKVSEKTAELHSTIPKLPSEAIPEVSAYFKESWGNRTRIDYGSGMELNFLCWILCLERLGAVRQDDEVALVIRVFWKYIQVMRVLQSAYWLEPAGSHGVWGLDDYHFLPFLWGSAQLKGHKHLRPKSIHDPDILEEFSKDYMYIACIQFINSVKTASLRWHSPMLDDISAVKTWDKVNSGMVKMYEAEVLGKLPVIQHFLFGSILPWDGPVISSTASEAEDECGHSHPTNLTPEQLGHIHPSRLAEATHTHGDLGGAGQRDMGWGDCCGIPVPSVFGAAQAEKEKEAGVGHGLRLDGPNIRPVPFD